MTDPQWLPRQPEQGVEPARPEAAREVEWAAQPVAPPITPPQPAVPAQPGIEARPGVVTTATWPVSAVPLPPQGYPVAPPGMVPVSAIPVPRPPDFPQGPYLVAPKPKRRWVGALTVTVALLVLVGMVGWQSFQIGELSDELRAEASRAQAERGDDLAAASAMASRIAALEGAAFLPDQIAAKALPSVFRVEAGDFSGTAWAVGRPTATGGTHLFTNFHVVEQVWERGDRDVGIEHRDLRFDATIVKVDEDNDIAQLVTTAKFSGLAISQDTARPGEPVVVVGAPFGLESSVTAGVVSAVRKLEGTDDTYVQFDAAINAGNSGGPVINAQGEVVGMATAKVREAEGIGLAIPIDLVCDLFPICG